MEDISNSIVVESVASPCEPAADAGRKGLVERFRKPISFAFVAIFLAAIWSAEGTAAYSLRTIESVLGFALVVTAAFGRIWCAVYIAGRKDAELCAQGPYSLCRNPLYVFSSFGMLGVLISTHRPLLALAGLGIYWAYYLWVIRWEESRLASIFGEAYSNYCDRVNAVIPRFSGYVESTKLVVDPRLLRKAFAEVAWFMAAWIFTCLVFANQ